MASAVWKYCGANPAPSDKKVITYVQRNIRGRRLTAKCEAELIDKISALPQVKLQIVDFASLSFKEQIQVTAGSDILLGVHGNGLSHTLFLPSRAALIELFPKNSFRVEYRIFANARGLPYYGWIDSQGWISHKAAEKGLAGNVYADELETDVDAIIAVIKERI